MIAVPQADRSRAHGGAVLRLADLGSEVIQGFAEACCRWPRWWSRGPRGSSVAPEAGPGAATALPSTFPSSAMEAASASVIRASSAYCPRRSADGEAPEVLGESGRRARASGAAPPKGNPMYRRWRSRGARPKPSRRCVARRSGGSAAAPPARKARIAAAASGIGTANGAKLSFQEYADFSDHHDQTGLPGTTPHRPGC